MNADEPIAFVGVGASAGGLEAIGTFISELPADTGAALILVQHLSPDHKSLMDELLSRRTSMPVCQAEDGMRARANHVYLIPPRKMITIFHGKLLLTDQDRSRGVNLAIDEFLQSLALDQQRRAIAVILSGTGSDGVRGVRDVKEHGGLVLVQDSESARFDGMPSAAAATGLADVIADPERLATDLAGYLRRGQTAGRGAIIGDEAAAGTALSRVFALLREQTGVDFSNYKPTTVLRRLERRVLVNHLVDLEDYLALLAGNRAEAEALYRELLIGVTRFFRDGDAFDRLRGGVVDDLLTMTAESSDLRVWVAGCSTGEEAYGLAILLAEAQARLGTTQTIKIFATDLDQNAIATAQLGVYPASVAAEVPADLLGHYFQSSGDGYQVVRSIREMVIFARHNLIKDPPFTNMHLITCRNVLIYFKGQVQRQVLEAFNYALNADGVLFLGSSESVGELADRFEAIDSGAKLFRSLGRRGVPPNRISLARRRMDSGERVEPPRLHRPNHGVLERFFTAIADELLPATILVNEQLEILHVLGDASPYLRIPSGSLVNDVTKLARADIHLPLTTGVQRALRTGETMRFGNVPVQDPAGRRQVEIRILPLPSRTQGTGMAAVMIQPSEDAVDPMADAGDTVTRYDESRRDQLADLEQELQFTRESLQATIEELETANEELQATNEELLSSNEELQSTNEELQSTNEELHTVNAEYQDKLHELAETNADLDNLLTTMSTGVLIVDETLTIRRFSTMVGDIVGILPGDVGRPLSHLTHDLVDCDLVRLVREVGSDGAPVEREVLTTDNRCYVLRIAPFTVGAGLSTGGVVVTFVDITDVRSLTQDITAFESDYQLLFETIDQAVSYQAADGTILTCNAAAGEIMGRTRDDMVGRLAADPGWRVVDRELRPLPMEQIPSERARLSRELVRDEVVGFHHPVSGEIRWVEVTAIPVTRADGQLHRIINIWRDISERHLEERERDHLLELMRIQSDLSRTAWYEWHIPEERVMVSPQHLAWLGIDPEHAEVDRAFWPSRIHPDDAAMMEAGGERILREGEAMVPSFRIRHADGSYLRCFYRARVVERDADGAPLRAVGILGLLPTDLACGMECMEGEH